MKFARKIPTLKVQALLRKLEALAARGVDGEKLAAQHKLALLKARYDFSTPAAADQADLFSGSFKRARTARAIYSFAPNDFDVINSVKWAIESGTRINCIYRGGTLLAEASVPTANKLREIATHIAESFRALLAQFSGLQGVTSADRSTFIRGLYDGMMNEQREAGELLPGSFRKPRKAKSKKQPAATAQLNLHPYTLGVSLGKQIRFSVPLEQIRADLETIAQKQLHVSSQAAAKPQP